jgi:hypothetical protein
MERRDVFEVISCYVFSLASSCDGDTTSLLRISFIWYQ